MPKSIPPKIPFHKVYPKKYYATNQVVLTKCTVHRNIKARKVYLLIQSGNQAVFTPLQAGLNSDPKKYHSFSFYDPNKYKRLANDNTKKCAHTPPPPHPPPSPPTPPPPPSGTCHLYLLSCAGYPLYNTEGIIGQDVLRII